MPDESSKSAKRRQLIRDTVSELLDDPLFKSWVKEIILMTIIEQDKIREEGKALSFIRQANRRGVTLRATKEGVVMVKGVGKLNQELRAILSLYRDKIWEHLMRSQPSTNGRINGHKMENK